MKVALIMKDKKAQEVKGDDILYTLLIPRYSSAMLEVIINDAIREHDATEPLSIYIDTLEMEIATCVSCILVNIRNRNNRDKIVAHDEQVTVQEIF